MPHPASARPSILRRFGATFIANVVGAGLSFAASLLLARGLGADKFGDFSFLLASFAAINTWLDLGTSNAFYTFACQGGDTRRHSRAFAAWLSLRFALVALAVVLLPSGWLARIWLGHERRFIFLALVAFFASVPLYTFLTQLAESVRHTLFIQTARVALAVVHFAVIIALWASHRLSVPVLFAVIIAEYVVLSGYFAACFEWSSLPSGKGEHPPLVRQYAAYCAPLALNCVLCALTEFGDRWLLQFFAGSSQQGFFSISQQFAAGALLATTSLINIYWKEIAELRARGELQALSDLYVRASRLLFFVSGAAAALAIPFSRSLLVRLAGPAYESAWPALAAMFLYPVFQTLGQLNGVFFYATEDTKTLVAIASASNALGLILSYFVLAPRTAVVPGLAFGAFGLAMRWSLWLGVTMVVQCSVVARRVGRRSDVAHHGGVLLFLIGASTLAYLAASSLVRALHPGAPDLWTFLLFAPLYGSAIASFVLSAPEHAGTSRAQLARLWPRSSTAPGGTPPVEKDT